MGSKKKDLQFLLNLQHKNRTNVGCDERSNMVGMYDVPATTMSWENFKSYLLTHTGSMDDELKVSYIDADNKEVPIENQQDFTMALYLFRARARLGEIVTLKLDRTPAEHKSTKPKRTRNSNDVQTQANCDVAPKQTPIKDDKPPEWFHKYMKQYKSEIVEEVSAAVLKITSKQGSAISVPCHHSRKCKSESTYKRNRKLPLLIGEANNEKESKKSFNKLERKLDHKLEKLENKTLRIKLKKVALARSSDSDVGRSSSKSRPIGLPLSDSDMLMDALATSDNDTTIPHMLGGESYMQQWEVINSGKLPWTDETELRYAWGSQALAPVSKRVNCPPLQPGEKGIVEVVLEVPETPGHYECYWHFHHNGRRFGHWLGCHVIVDEPVRSSALMPCDYYDLINFVNTRGSPDRSLYLSSSPKKAKIEEPLDLCTDNVKIENASLEQSGETNLNQTGNVDFALNEDIFLKNSQHTEDVKKCIEEVSSNLNNLVLESSKMGVYCSDSDNQSIVSIADSNFSLSSEAANDYVVIDNDGHEKEKIENSNSSHNTTSDIEILECEDLNKVVVENAACFVPDLIRGDDFNNINNNNISTMEDLELGDEKKKPDLLGSDSNGEAPVDLTIKTEPIDNTENHTKEAEVSAEQKGFAYVHYEGQKIPMPKKYLSEKYLETAEEAPTPVDSAKQEYAKEQEGNSVKMSQSDYVPSENNFMLESSHCSAIASSFSETNESTRNAPSNISNNSSPSNRLFVFPQNCPGFEVVYPSFDVQYHELDSLNQIQENCSRPPGPICKSPSENSSWSACSNIRNESSYYNCSNQCSGHTIPHVEPCHSHASSYASCPHVHKQVKVNSPCMVNRSNGTHCMHCFEDPFVNSPCFSSASHHHKHQSNAETASFHSQNSTGQKSMQESDSQNRENTVHILPETVVTGAAILASSALNTARNVFNMIVPNKNTESGRWENGHWISTNPESPREVALRTLAEMGFTNRDLNATLLARYNDNVERVIYDLV